MNILKNLSQTMMGTSSDARAIYSTVALTLLVKHVEKFNRKCIKMSQEKGQRNSD